MTLTEKKTPRWRLGFNRWLVLVLLIISAIAAGRFAPIQPHFQVPAEILSAQPLFTIPLLNAPVYLSNTLTAILFVDLILILIAIAVRIAVGSGELVPRGVSGAIEALLEAVYNLTQTNAGKWAKTIFPFFATLLLIIFVANTMELIPGVDSIDRKSVV